MWTVTKDRHGFIGSKLCWQGNLFGVWNTELGLASNISSWDSLTFYALAEIFPKFSSGFIFAQ